MTQPQPYTGRLSHPQKGRLHITFEGLTTEQVKQKAVAFYWRAGLIGRYYLDILQGEQHVTQTHIQ